MSHSNPSTPVGSSWRRNVFVAVLVLAALGVGAVGAGKFGSDTRETLPVEAPVRVAGVVAVTTEAVAIARSSGRWKRPGRCTDTTR